MVTETDERRREREVSDEIAARGEALYEAGIRTQVEPENIGRLVLIDVVTGAWVLGEDRVQMARQLRAQNTDAVLYGMRVGYPAASSIGGVLRPLAAAEAGHDKEAA